MVRASLRGMLASFSSAREKPRPARTRRLYLTVGQRTTGRSLSTGLGATRAAFSLRESRREAFLPGCEGGCQVNAILCTAGAAALKARGELPGQSARGRDAANPCGSLRRVC